MTGALSMINLSMLQQCIPTEPAGGTLADTDERTVSCQRMGLIGEDHELKAVPGIGALLPPSLVTAIKEGKPVDDLRPIEVSMRVH